MKKSAQSQPRPQHRGKRKWKNCKAAFSVPTEFLRLIITMASVNIQGNDDIRTVVSSLLLLCKVCSVQCVCVLLWWCVLIFVISYSHLKTMILSSICRSTWRPALHTLSKRFVTESQCHISTKISVTGHQWRSLILTFFVLQFPNKFRFNVFHQESNSPLQISLSWTPSRTG